MAHINSPTCNFYICTLHASKIHVFTASQLAKQILRFFTEMSTSSQLAKINSPHVQLGICLFPFDMSTIRRRESRRHIADRIANVPMHVSRMPTQIVLSEKSHTCHIRTFESSCARLPLRNRTLPLLELPVALQARERAVLQFCSEIRSFWWSCAASACEQSGWNVTQTLAAGQIATTSRSPCTAFRRWFNSQRRKNTAAHAMHCRTAGASLWWSLR